jgi:MOSC domain-containing protein YiiM
MTAAVASPPASRAMFVEHVNVAQARRVLIDGRLVLTAIHKQTAPGSVAVGPLGLEGDEQADLSVHGGPSKAVYLYPAEHHGFWDDARREAGAQTARTQMLIEERSQALGPGAMGENLSTRGLTEDMLWIGDELHLPDAVFVVSEPRMPCFKFNAAMGFTHASKRMVQSGFCGAYVSVRTAGRVQAGDPMRLVPGPREMRLLDVFHGRARA